MIYEDNNLMPYEGDNNQMSYRMEDYEEFGKLYYVLRTFFP